MKDSKKCSRCEKGSELIEDYSFKAKTNSVFGEGHECKLFLCHDCILETLGNYIVIDNVDDLV